MPYCLILNHIYIGDDKTKGHYNLILINEHILDLIKNLEKELILKNNNIESINLNNHNHNFKENLKYNENNQSEKRIFIFQKMVFFLIKI